MSMEEFTVQVAWPRVQPSPFGGGKASVAQKPQSEPQPQPEATPETTPRTSPITTLGVEVFHEEDGIADTDYAANMAAAQSTWDPWHFTAQDIPQPSQDAPSSPLDEPTAAAQEP